MVNRPLRILSLGAGVQSTTVALMANRGLLEPIDHAIFADTGWEPRAVYDHLGRLEEHLDFPIHRVSAGNLRDDALTEGRFVSMPVFIRKPDGDKAILRRQCTKEYKLTPIFAKVRELVGLEPRQRPQGHLADIILGISLDEAQRMRDPHYQWTRNDYPLVDRRLTRHDCNLWLTDNWPHPVPRSACIGCPYRSDHEWRQLRDEAPDEWQDAVDFDNQIRQHRRGLGGDLYLHPTLVPLATADLTTPEDHGQGNLFGNECEGMCGV